MSKKKKAFWYAVLVVAVLAIMVLSIVFKDQLGALLLIIGILAGAATGLAYALISNS